MYTPLVGNENQSFKEFHIKVYTKFVSLFGAISAFIIPFYDMLTIFRDHRNEENVYADSIRISGYNSFALLILISVQREYVIKPWYIAGNY